MREVPTCNGWRAARRVVSSEAYRCASTRPDVKIAPRDMDQIHAGQTATMRWPAFNQRDHRRNRREVRLGLRGHNLDQRVGTSYYTARVILKPKELVRLGSARLLSSMPAEVFIKTQHRTALSYLLKPPHKAGPALKERRAFATRGMTQTPSASATRGLRINEHRADDQLLQGVWSRRAWLEGGGPPETSHKGGQLSRLRQA